MASAATATFNPPLRKINCHSVLLTSQHPKKRELSQISRLKVFVQNMDRLWIPDDMPSPQQTNYLLKNRLALPKDEENIRAIVANISEEDPDIIEGIEVIHYETFRNLNKYYLNNEYSYLTIKGNDLYGSQIGFWVKKDLPFQFELRTNRERTWLKEGVLTRIHTRDVPELLMRLTGRELGPPFAALVGTHAKAHRLQIVSKNHVAENPSDARARIEFLDTAEILKNLENEFPGLPYAYSGDLNRSPGDELVGPIRALGLVNARDIPKIQNSTQNRFTQVRFDNDNQFVSHLNEIDSVFVSPTLLPAVKKFKVLYPKQKDGSPVDFSTVKKDPSLFPSDHFAMVFEIDLQRILASQPQP